MKISKDDINRNFFLHDFKNIVKTDTGYKLQQVYREVSDDEIIETEESKNNPNDNYHTKNCGFCVHGDNYGKWCSLRKRLENKPSNHTSYSHWVNKCDAYEPIDILTLISSKEDMIQFVVKAEGFFQCPEDYEYYFGFERNWNEETGDILETTKEYYNRGGQFSKIPDKFPCVIYFGQIDDERIRSDKLEWIYIGGSE